jgi:hypothetical protein
MACEIRDSYSDQNFDFILLLAAINYLGVAVNLESYLQPDDDIDTATYLNATANSTICARECAVGEKPKICYYRWTVENYATLSE